jgi:hypothetical protein
MSPSEYKIQLSLWINAYIASFTDSLQSLTVGITFTDHFDDTKS